MASTSRTIAVLGGINGAGKTTASKRILHDALAIPIFVNADAIARGLNGFDPESESVKAGRIMLDHLHDLVARGQSFAFDPVCSDLRSLARPNATDRLRRASVLLLA